MERVGRGDGIGIELTRGVVRGVLLAADDPHRLHAATEVGIRHFDDDRSVLDALIRLRAELGPSRAPTRVALFPPGSTLHRVDVTSLTGPELNVTRSRLLQADGVSSTVLIDDGPRRWLFAVRWDDPLVRRLEELVEHAGFVDVAIDPSPVALSRVLVDSVMARRDAALGESPVGEGIRLDGDPIGVDEPAEDAREPGDDEQGNREISSQRPAMSKQDIHHDRQGEEQHRHDRGTPDRRRPTEHRHQRLSDARVLTGSRIGNQCRQTQDGGSEGQEHGVDRAAVPAGRLGFREEFEVQRAVRRTASRICHGGTTIRSLERRARGRFL